MENHQPHTEGHEAIGKIATGRTRKNPREANRESICDPTNKSSSELNSRAARKNPRESVREAIKKHAHQLGFDLVGFSHAKIEDRYLKVFEEWLAADRHGCMEYMEKLEKRKDLTKIFPGAQSVIVLAMNYYHHQPMYIHGDGNGSTDANSGIIARYAYGRDYHKIITKKLKQLEKFIEQCAQAHRYTCNGRLTKSYVDTGPLMERALAEQAGIGRIGKNGCLITKEFGSWIFLAEIITTLDLTGKKSSAPTIQNSKLTFVNTATHVLNGQSGDRWSGQAAGGGQHSSLKPGNVCGNCTKCIDACPTGAIIAPGIIDSRLCISYLTIENKDKIPPKLAKIIAKTKRLYGCDICQEVCPHNHARQRINTHPEFQTPIAGNRISLKKLQAIKTDEKFTETFAGSPLMRAKRQGLQRNATYIKNFNPNK